MLAAMRGRLVSKGTCHPVCVGPSVRDERRVGSGVEEARKIGDPRRCATTMLKRIAAARRCSYRGMKEVDDDGRVIRRLCAITYDRWKTPGLVAVVVASGRKKNVHTNT